MNKRDYNVVGNEGSAKDAQRQRGNLLCLRRLSSVSFSGFAKAKTEQFPSEPLR